MNESLSTCHRVTYRVNYNKQLHVIYIYCFFVEFQFSAERSEITFNVNVIHSIHGESRIQQDKQSGNKQLSMPDNSTNEFIGER